MKDEIGITIALVSVVITCFLVSVELPNGDRRLYSEFGLGKVYLQLGDETATRCI
jgi:hypothetical protein